MTGHEYATREVEFGKGAFFQAACTCGWLCGITHRADRDASPERKRMTELLARGEFESHYMQAVA